jgi:hypothetical protein
MTALATPPKLQFLDANGAPLVGGKLYTYAAGTTTPLATYTDYGGGTANANPVILDSRGEASVWLGTALYKMALYSATDVLIWTVDNIGGFATLAQLAASGGSNLVGFLQAGTGAVATTVQAKLRESVSVKDFGAVGDDSNDDTAEIQAAITSLSAGGVLYFPPGTYKVSAALNLVSNLTMEFAGGAKLKHASGVTTEYILRGATKDNLVFRDMVIEGNGAFGLSAVYLTSGNNILFDNCTITKSGSMAILHDTCTFVKVQNCDLSSNYYYGVDERNGTGNKYINNRFFQNGITGVATSTGGRGINIWKSIDTYVAGCRFAGNNEYGFRLYSEAADTPDNRGCRLSDCYFRDNTGGDIVIYNESDQVIRHTISGCIVETTINAALGAQITLQGDNTHVVNTHVHKSGAIGTGAAFVCYQANQISLIGCSATNFNEAFSFGASTNVVIDSCLGDTIAVVSTTTTGSGIRVKNSHFIHGGVGVSDVAIINYNATGKNYYEGNIFSGFHTGIYIASEAVAIFRNTTTSSGFAGLRLSGNNFSLLECGENSWDITAPYLLSAMTKTVSTYDRATTVYNIAPTTLTWAVGDRCYNEAPAVGQPKSWVCTVAGTPGTWVSEGNL